MKNKIKNIKKSLMTIAAVVCGIVASNYISDSGLVETSYASGASGITIGEPGLAITPGGDGSFILTGAGNADMGSILTSMIKVIKWITLIGTIVLLGIFVYNLIKMGAAGTNVQNRASAQQALVWSGVSAGLLTIATSVFFFMTSVFK